MAKRKQSTGQVSGTKEWASETVNFCNGCSNACIYCYARYRAVERFHWMTHEDWPNEVVRDDDVGKKRKRIAGRVMIPSTHDITPGNIDAAETVMVKLLEVGNHVLIVSKPRLECIRRLCTTLAPHRDRVHFRFTIGVIDEKLCSFWEPNAPAYAERLQCLGLARDLGYETSVSAEPLLEPWRVQELVDDLRSHVTHSIWIGKLNHLHARTRWRYPNGHPVIDRLERWQSDEKLIEVYEAFNGDPLIRWKESYKKVVGLARPTVAGLDI